MSKKIKLTQGKQAIVDDEDYKFLNNLNWYCGTVKSKVSSLELDYARLMIHQAEEGKNTSQKNSGGLVLAQLLIRGKQGYKITYKNGDYKIVIANDSLEVIKKYDLCTAENVSTRITQLEGEQESIALSNN